MAEGTLEPQVPARGRTAPSFLVVKETGGARGRSTRGAVSYFALFFLAVFFFAGVFFFARFGVPVPFFFCCFGFNPST